MTSRFRSSEIVIPEAKHYQPLAEFFPAAEGYEVAHYNKLTGSTIATLVEGPVKSTHYIEHFFPFESAPITQLRVVPSSTSGPDLVSWLAVEMYGLHGFGEQSLLDTLDGEDVYAYLANDPITQKQNVYVFLDQDVPRAEAQELASHLRAIVAFRSEPPVLSFPAVEPQERRRTALPFVRGALTVQDRPPAFLLDASRRRLTLEEFTSHVQRTSPEAIRRLPLPSIDDSTHLELSTPEQDLVTWERELARAETHWDSARAQDLSLALAGLGVYLGVEELDVYSAVHQICVRVEDPDAADRLIAVVNTYRKWQGGQHVAFRMFYERAGLTPPTIKGVSRELLNMLDDLIIQIPEQEWNLRTRTVDQALYRKLIALARSHGSKSTDGIEISISERDLALQLGVTRATVQKAIKRLTELRLVKRADQGRGIGAGSYRIIASKEKRTSLSQSSFSQVFRDEWDTYVRFARNGPGRLGKPAVEALVALARSSESMNARQWAASLGIKPDQLRRRRVSLQAASLVETAENKHRYTPVADWQERLNRILVDEGSFKARERDRDSYEHERRVFREVRHQSRMSKPKK